MSKAFLLTLFIAQISFAQLVMKDGIITGYDTKERVVVLTFDACETKTPSYFDHKILDYLVNEKIKSTIFLGGKFAIRNEKEIQKLKQYDFLSFENHSMNHFQNMEKLKSEEIINEVLRCDSVIFKITGKKSKYFRFPAGNYDIQTVKKVKDLGYDIVHWTFPSGDPDKKITANKLLQGIKNNIKPGSILIFHINGRGYKTGEILPDLISYLRKNNYKIISLEQLLRGNF